MADKDAKKNVAPGIVKSKGYAKPTKNKTINPTLKTVVDDLPSAQKLEIYSQYYEEKKSDTNWIPPQDQLNITEDMRKQSKPKLDDKDSKAIEVKKVDKFKKPPKKENIQVVDIPKVIDKKPTDMEILLQNEHALKEEKLIINEVVSEIPEEIVSTESPAISMENVFATVNKNISVEVKTDNSEALLKEKPFMRVDKIEVRTSVNADGVSVYMVGKKVYSKIEFNEFLQSVSGKILVLECKHLELRGVEYKLAGDKYIASNGNTYSIDEMLDMLAQER